MRSASCFFTWHFVLYSGHFIVMQVVCVATQPLLVLTSGDAYGPMGRFASRPLRGQGVKPVSPRRGHAIRYTDERVLSCPI